MPSPLQKVATVGSNFVISVMKCVAVWGIVERSGEPNFLKTNFLITQMGGK